MAAPVHCVIDDSITCDASISEQHARTAVLTKHPVEQGADVTDHIRVEPDGLQVEALFTNTPLDAIARQARGQSAPLQAGFAEQSVEKLRQLVTAKRAVNVVTARRSYTNMVLVSVGEPVTAQTGDAVRCSLRFETIVFARNEVVRLESVARPVDTKQPTKPDKQGKQSGTEEKSTILNDLLFNGQTDSSFWGAKP